VEKKFSENDKVVVNKLMILLKYSELLPILRVLFNQKQDSFLYTKIEEQPGLVNHEKLNLDFLHLALKFTFHSHEYKDLLQPLNELSSDFYNSKRFITPENHQNAIDAINKFSLATPNYSLKLNSLAQFYNDL
jgi:hypothetical protein